MRTDFSTQLLATDAGQRANDILRACVHCGFCNATCPTYQLTGDELDGPRGRIYLMRELLETGSNKDRAQRHLDRCLTCRACETTCPSGVAYGDLLDISRQALGPERAGWQGLLSRNLRNIVPNAKRLRAMVRLGKLFAWFLPKSLAQHLPRSVGKANLLNSVRVRRVILLNGCAQQVSTPNTNAHLVSMLERHNIGVVTRVEEACCGALDLHLGADETSKDYMRRNVDAFYPLLEEVEAIISTASGCGVTYKDYGRLLAADPEYAMRANAVAQKVMDVSEYLATQGLGLRATLTAKKVAWHAPCSLQHGQQLAGDVEQLLVDAGYTLIPVADAHLCCGSAGTYSILQPDLSDQLRDNKLQALQQGGPEVIATANVGCQTHLHNGSKVDVLHWIELLK